MASPPPLSPPPEQPEQESVLMLSDILSKFAKVDPYNRQVIGLKGYNLLSAEIRYTGPNPFSVDPTMESVTFVELCALTQTALPELPVSANVLAEVFRKVDSVNKGSVSWTALVAALGYVYPVPDAETDSDVNYEQALQKLTGPEQEYKLNVYKDIFRKFGKDGSGSLTQTELGLASRFLERPIDVSPEMSVVTFQDILLQAIGDPNHPVITLGVNMNEVRRAFDWCDADHVGYLDSGELGKALRLAGQNPTQADFKRLKAGFDSQQGLFDFTQFTEVITNSYVSVDEIRKSTRDAFKTFDTNNTGKITLKNLRRIMTTYGEDLKEEEVDELFESMCTPDNGVVDIDEFVDMIVGN